MYFIPVYGMPSCSDMHASYYGAYQWWRKVGARKTGAPLTFKKGGRAPPKLLLSDVTTVSERSKYSNRTVKHFNRAVRHCNRTVKYSIITVNCKIIINGTAYKNNQQKQEIIMLSDAISEH